MRALIASVSFILVVGPAFAGPMASIAPAPLLAAGPAARSSARNCVLPDNTGTVCDVLLSKVQIFTTLGEDFRQMDVEQQAMIVAAVDIGRLVDNSDVDEEQWLGVEVDKVVLGWENLDHSYDHRRRLVQSIRERTRPIEH